MPPNTLLSGWWLGSMAIQSANNENSSSPPFTQALGAMMIVMGFLWVALAIFDGLILFRVRMLMVCFVHGASAEQRGGAVGDGRGSRRWEGQ